VYQTYSSLSGYGIQGVSDIFQIKILLFTQLQDTGCIKHTAYYPATGNKVYQTNFMYRYSSLPSYRIQGVSDIQYSSLSSYGIQGLSED
jgi:hypothetical protein